MKTRRAFTLVELLVVIGIIAVLVGILLPTLSAARKQADMVKCAASLREVGAAVLNYVNDNRGYMIPARCGSNYNLYGIRYGAAAEVPNVSTITPAYWINFLGKYVSKNRMGTGATTAQEAADAQRSVLWGCPAYGRYASTAIGGFNRVQNGYGFNYVPTYTATYPALGVSYPPNYSGSPPDGGKNSVLDSTAQWINNPTPTTGTWFKFNAYTKSAERCLAADGQFWIVEALAPPLSGVIPPQKISNNVATYSAGVSGQTLFDFYRHGKYPPIEVYGNTGYYNASGGKSSYNILYCDGHVSNTGDRSEAYRSVRMRFPG